MSINTGALFERARTLVDGAVDAAGTRVETFTRTSAGLTKPKDTKLWAGAAIHTIVGATNGASAREMVSGIVLMPTDWKLVCKASTPVPQEESHVRILKCRTKTLVGLEAKLLGVKTDSSGAHVTLFYRPTP